MLAVYPWAFMFVIEVVQSLSRNIRPADFFAYDLNILAVLNALQEQLEKRTLSY